MEYLFTVAYHARPLAVVRTATAAEAVARAHALMTASGFPAPVASAPGFNARPPTAGELCAWLDGEDDTLLPSTLAAALG